jgi:hypothetical protein
MFQKNYRLHDLAQKFGEECLKEWGIEFHSFGEDKRKEKVWEAGKDKPDVVILRDGVEIGLLDWKGKRRHDWKMNERAYDAYAQWGEEKHLKVFVAMAVIDLDTSALRAFKFIQIPCPDAIAAIRHEWDKNRVVVFKEQSMKDFTRELFERALYG